eukprot:19006-Heterococcus_DN1.PRE.3
MADETGKLIGMIGDEDTITGFLLAGVGHRTAQSTNFLVVKPVQDENRQDLTLRAPQRWLRSAVVSTLSNSCKCPGGSACLACSLDSV